MPPYPQESAGEGRGGEGRTGKRKGGGGEGKDGMGKEGQEKRGKGRAGTWKEREFGGGGEYASWPLGGMDAPVGTCYIGLENTGFPTKIGIHNS
jgi:hypothetical protein